MTLCSFGIHKWSKWESYKWTGTTIRLVSDKTYNGAETRQKRTCSRCGFMRDDLISQG